MALQSCVLVPAAVNGVTSTLATVTATSAIVIGQRGVFVLTVDQNCTITFGDSTGHGNVAATPSATVGLLLLGGTSCTFDLGTEFDSFKIFNTSGGTANYSYQPLSKF
jgi:hypothetical protein